MSVFRLQDLNPFLVLQLITDFLTINFPNTVDGILPSCPHFIYIPLLSIVKHMVSQGTSKTLFLFVYNICFFMTGVLLLLPQTLPPRAPRRPCSLPCLPLSLMIVWNYNRLSCHPMYLDQINHFYNCLMYLGSDQPFLLSDVSSRCCCCHVSCLTNRLDIFESAFKLSIVFNHSS